MTSEVRKLVGDFSAALERAIAEGVTARLEAALGGLTRRGGATSARERPAIARAARRKGPVQLCPVPRCANRAAPSLGMVCMKHRDVPKATIRKYREARRARKG